MPKTSKILLLIVSVVLVFTVFFGARGASVSAASMNGQTGTPEVGAYAQMAVYTEVLRHIQSDYVEDPNIGNVTNGALRGLLESLDADSSYLTPNDYKAYKAAAAAASGKAQVGMVVSKRFGYATVVSVVPGSPADKAGIVDADPLEAINGVDTRDLSLAVINMMLNGQAGTELSVSVVRPRKTVPDKVTMTRVMVTQPPVSEMLYENASILYLKPVALDHDHVQAMEAKLKTNEKANKKVLLDLRDVASGDMSEATRLANFFLKTGTIATLEGQRVEKIVYTADAAKALDPTAPLVVLVNRGTAGPGELVAAALLDDKRAELVGERTFGAGAEQKTFELAGGAALILSVAKYESPSGKKLQDDGVTPGVLVAGPIPDGDPSVDEDTVAATETPKTAVAPVKKTVTVDEQLNKGLELLKAKA